MTYDLCFVPAVASVHIIWLENQSVSYLVIQFGNFCNWSHKHVLYTWWHLILFLLLFYSREEKNVALAELRDELLASKKSLESLRQEVSKKERNSDYYQSSWSSAICQWKGWRSCSVCCTSHPYSLPLSRYQHHFLTSQLSCHVTVAVYVWNLKAVFYMAHVLAVTEIGLIWLRFLSWPSFVPFVFIELMLWWVVAGFSLS